MSKPLEQIEMDIADFLEFGGRVVAEPNPPRVTKRPHRMPARPSMTKDTKIEVPDRNGYPYTVVLRPAEVRVSYAGSSGGIRMVTVAKRSEDTWLVLTKSGRYLGVLQEWTGREPWAVAKLAEETVTIGDRGVRVRDLLLTGVTWQEAVAQGARVWWAR